MFTVSGVGVGNVVSNGYRVLRFVFATRCAKDKMKREALPKGTCLPLPVIVKLL